MVDWIALEELDSALRRMRRQLQSLLGDAHELGIAQMTDVHMNARSTSTVKAFVEQLPNYDEIRKWRFNLENALKEKATPQLIGTCLVSELFPRTVYNIGLPKQTYLEDVCDLLEEAEPASCVATFGAIRSIARNVSFVPPAGQIADKILAEESGLHSLLHNLVRCEQLRESIAPRANPHPKHPMNATMRPESAV